jgi:hypothetical protein
MKDEAMVRDLLREAASVIRGPIDEVERAERLAAIRREVEAWGGNPKDMPALGEEKPRKAPAAKRSARKSPQAAARSKR